MSSARQALSSAVTEADVHGSIGDYERARAALNDYDYEQERRNWRQAPDTVEAWVELHATATANGELVLVEDNVGVVRVLLTVKLNDASQRPYLEMEGLGTSAPIARRTMRIPAPPRE